MTKRKDTTTLLGILLLVIGLAAGIFLVLQTQYFRNKAKVNETFTVCHRLDPQGTNWVEIEVKREELGEYLNSGDKFGKCQ